LGIEAQKNSSTYTKAKSAWLPSKKKSNNGKLPRKETKMQAYAFTFFS
jgi:hypothetical protein